MKIFTNEQMLEINKKIEEEDVPEFMIKLSKNPALTFLFKDRVIEAQSTLDLSEAAPKDVEQKITPSL